ncbi:QueT transporter family protein [Petrocella atlantisensis]|uniref:QueT transporter family protein n=1 Tax=Petrocella atlantisensis TaxID=2173034 RepID=A0A3P7NWL2_9FIRM|nr:QueT transporter family protein [Petrocella atlantisensis]VDN47594.1 QueT transporter family protein [Petrocella atlantisensis]
MNKKTKYLVQSGVIAAIYVVLAQVFGFMGFGPIQFRIAEALTVLPFFTPAAIPGVFIGCLLANILYGGVLLDVVFGSLTTLLAAYLSYRLRKNKWMVTVPPILLNAAIIPFVLKYGYGVPDGIPFMMGTIFLGQFIVVGIIGMVLLHALLPLKDKIFQ